MKSVLVILFTILLSSASFSQEQSSSPIIIADDKLSAPDVLTILKEYDRRYEQRFSDLEKIVNEKFTANEKAIRIATEANEKRFESVNEFRSQLKDQASTLMPRAEYTSRHEAVVSDISQLRLQVLANQSRLEGAQWLFGIFTTLVVILIAGMSMYLNNKTRQLSQLSERSSK